MKAMLLAVAVISVVIGVFAYVVYRDPNRAQTQDALAVLHENSSGVPQDPAATGYLNLKKRHPDGLEGVDEFKLYSAEQSAQRMDQMEGFLTSFRKLTGAVRGRISSAELTEVGNTGSEMQTIGFHNIPLIVEGTILKQEYLLRQVEYKLAQLKRVGGDVNSEELEAKRQAYDNATKNFQTFWDTKLPTD